jgi:MFS transporter, SHS family, sialic acid transporter
MGVPERWYQGINRGQWLAMIAAILGWMFDGFEMGLHPLVAYPALQELLRDVTVEDVRAEVSALPDSEAKSRLLSALEKSGLDVFQAVKDTLKSQAAASSTMAGALAQDTVDSLSKTVERRVKDWNAYLTAVFLFGAAAGGLVFGWLGDRVGRTKAMMWSVLAYSLFTGLGGFAVNPWHLAICRVLAALGMGGEWALGVALVMETWPARARPMMAGFIGAASNAGFLLVAVIKLFLDELAEGEINWRWLMFIGVLPALLTFLIRLFVPESEKWQKAAAHAPKPRVREVFSSGLGKLTVLAILLCGVALLGTWGSIQWIAPWVDQMRAESPDRVPAAGKQYAQICSAFGACVGTVLAALIAGRFGRRPTYILLCLLSLMSTTLLFRFEQLFDIKPAVDALFLILVFLAGVTTASFYGWIPLYLPELFPTRVRATGQGLAYNFGRIFAGVGTLVLTGPLANFFKGGNLAPTLATVSLIYVLGLVLIFFAPETHGKPLPE